MLTRRLIERLHQGAYIRRWNDHIHPEQGFTELDKQAHKMVIAFFLARLEEKLTGCRVDAWRLIEGGIAQYFHRVELTDIKPPIFHRLMEKHGKSLNSYVIGQCEPDLAVVGDGTFFDRFCQHLEENLALASDLSLEHRILEAAHYLATRWEFELIYPSNRHLYGIEETHKQVKDKLDLYQHMASVRYVSQHPGYDHLFNLIGQLRFQRRWTQTVRIPETSVLGHSLVVAILAYLVSLERGMDIREQAVHHFWVGLFHDIPEVLTRDIISPVKRSVPELDTLIKEIEEEELDDKVGSLFETDQISREIGEVFFWYVKTEFQDAIYPGCTKTLDGHMLKHCGLYAAYVEASLSLDHGVSSRPLVDGRRTIEQSLSAVAYDGFRWRLLLDYFA